MSVIRNNPYRILGLFGNSSEKELQKQIATIKRFAEVGKLKAFDYDFPFLGEVDRSAEKVQEAASKIEQAKNKVHYALFWFLNNGHIDETALNNLKEGHIDKAAEIWEKTLKDTVVTSKNFSAITNLSTLQLGIVTYNGSFDTKRFATSIELKRKLLLSEAFNNFIAIVIGKDISINRDIILKEFADEILETIEPYLNKPNGLKSIELINAFNLFPNEIKQYILGKFTDRPLSNIENQIEKTKQKRIETPSKAVRYGEKLFNESKEDLLSLKKILYSENLQLQVTINKVAQEILQCAIDFFVHYKDNVEYDPGEEALRLMKIAKSLSPTGQVKSRIDENLENIQQWIDDKPERARYNKVKNELEFIEKELEQFQRLGPSIENAKNLAVSCKPYIVNMKKILGATDEFYLKISSVIVGNTQDMLVAVVNDEQEILQFLINPNSANIQRIISMSKRNKLISLFNLTETLPDRYTALTNFKTIITTALEVTNLLNSFDMSAELKKQYVSNKAILQNIYNQIASGDKSSSGCYLATMAYGSYEHPQVLELRKFRDNTLSKSAVGRGFIRTYYKYSPKLVEHLKDKPLVNQIIKSILNTLIRIIK